MDLKGIEPSTFSLQTKHSTIELQALMRLMGAAPMTFGWKPNVLLLNYNRLIAVDRIELPPEGHEPPELPLHHTAIIIS